MQFNLKAHLKNAAIVSGIMLFLDLIGLPLTLERAVIPVFMFFVGLFSFFFLRKNEASPVEGTAGGLMIGGTAGAVLALVTAFFASLQADAVQINRLFAQILPEHTGALTGLTRAEVLAGAPVFGGLLTLWLLLLISGGIGGYLSTFSAQNAVVVAPGFANRLAISLPFVFFGLYLALRIPGVNISANDENTVGLVLVFFFIAAALFAFRRTNRGRDRLLFSLIIGIIVVALPLLNDSFQNAVLGIVMIYIVMGIGLNIVVGYAGLLDLGYVGFFAVGAYGYALLAAPNSFVLNIMQFGGINFWTGLVIAIMIGALAGILLGIPVLRLRGDYLAIVTLGFGEIIRLVLLNLRIYTGGPGGVLNIPPPIFFGIDLGNPQNIVFLGLVSAAVVAYISVKVRRSRVGRAWIAMRDDEDTAEAMGINLVSHKLLAFAIGAAFAAAAGAIYAARQVNIFPDNFALDVSINVLSLIIIGGIGSIEGVILGAIALVGLPEILRSVDEYRILAFGAMLVLMMALRPEGLLPARDEEDDGDELSPLTEPQS